MGKEILSILVLITMLQNGYAAMPTDPEFKVSIEYVTSLDNACSYADGYLCENIVEENFLFPSPSAHMIPGIYLLAWEASYADFKRISDLSDEQKKLVHYKIGFTENKTQFIVLFNALLLPRIEQGEPAGLLTVTLGRSTKYWIDRNTLEIIDRKFLK
jgi:hypothetical protein